MYPKNSIFPFLLGTIFSFLCIIVTAQIDTSPKPYGGNQLMRDFICNEMIYPESALENKTEGTVKVGLTVMADGKKTNYRIVESISPELDIEALRICRLIMFYPAVKSSNYIIENVLIPVKFNIKKYQRNCKQKGYINYEAYSGVIDTSMIVYASSALNVMPSPYFEDPSMTFGKFIMDNIKYPDAAFKEDISGQVELSFVVETSGRISNIEIVDPLGGGCSEEAIHLLKQTKWKPGIRKNVAVRSFMTANISFSLGASSDHKYLPNHNNTTM
jgi:TonB family protein